MNNTRVKMSTVLTIIDLAKKAGAKDITINFEDLSNALLTGSRIKLNNESNTSVDTISSDIGHMILVCNKNKSTENIINKIGLMELRNKVIEEIKLSNDSISKHPELLGALNNSDYELLSEACELNISNDKELKLLFKFEEHGVSEDPIFEYTLKIKNLY